MRWLWKLIAKIECLILGHGPLIRRIDGIELKHPTCLECGKSFPEYDHWNK